MRDTSLPGSQMHVVQPPVREEGGALGWARAMEQASKTRQVAVYAAPVVSPVDPQGVAYAGWALAFAFFLLLLARGMKERVSARQLTLHGDVPELFLIPKGLLGRRPRR